MPSTKADQLANISHMMHWGWIDIECIWQKIEFSFGANYSRFSQTVT